MPSLVRMKRNLLLHTRKRSNLYARLGGVWVLVFILCWGVGWFWCGVACLWLGILCLVQSDSDYVLPPKLCPKCGGVVEFSCLEFTYNCRSCGMAISATGRSPLHYPPGSAFCFKCGLPCNEFGFCPQCYTVKTRASDSSSTTEA